MAKELGISVTMEDIALLSGVSRASVSAVLNGSRNIRVSAETREKVLRHARELGYIPQVVTPALSKGFVAILVHGGHPRGGFLASRLQLLLLQHGYDTLVSGMSVASIGKLNFSLTAPEELISMGARGMIVLDGAFPRKRLEQLHVPFSCHSAENHSDSDVIFDKSINFELLTEHLRVAHGHRDIGFISVRSEKRLDEIWKKTAEKFDLSHPAERSFRMFDHCGDADALFAWIARQKLTAVLTQNDHVAAKIMKAALQRGMKLPEDLAIVGHDGLSLCDYTPLSITTAYNPIMPLANALFRALEERMAGREPERPVVIPGKIRAGASCGCPDTPVRQLFTRNTMTFLELDAKINYNVDLFSTD